MQCVSWACRIFFYFFNSCAGSSLLPGLFSSCGERGLLSSRYTGLSLQRLLLLQSTGSIVVAQGHGCSMACRIFLNQGSNPCPLHWQADSLPLSHQRSPRIKVLMQEYPALSGGEGLMRTGRGVWGRVEVALHIEDLKGRRFGTGMQQRSY